MKTPAAGHRRPPKHMHLVAEVCDDSWRHQRQEFGKTFCQVLSHVVRKVAIFHPSWSQNGVWAPSGAMMGPGRQKQVPTLGLVNPFGTSFLCFWSIFCDVFFNVFWEGLFFGPWPTFGRPRCPKGCQKERNDSKKGGKRELKVRKDRFRRTLIFGRPYGGFVTL